MCIFEFQKETETFMNRVLRIVAGALFILAGLTAIVIPIVPTWILVLTGLTILSSDVPFIRRNMHKLRARFPRFTQLQNRFFRDSDGRV